MAWLVFLTPVFLHIAWSDFFSRRIPNTDLMVLMVSGVCVAVAGASPVQLGLWQALFAGGVALVCFVPFYCLGWMGAGDVKLAAALGVWLGLPLLLPVWGGSVAMAIAYGAWAQGPFWRKSFQTKAGLTGDGNHARRVVPYGAMLCAAAALVMGAQFF